MARVKAGHLPLKSSYRSVVFSNIADNHSKMSATKESIRELFNRIPRRHTNDNVKEIYSILDEYEALLQLIEAESPEMEKFVIPFFDALEPIRKTIKKSSDNKASKKVKDTYFDEASGELKDSMEALLNQYKK
jgi:hypothetical protein